MVIDTICIVQGINGLEALFAGAPYEFLTEDALSLARDPLLEDTFVVSGSS